MWFVIYTSKLFQKKNAYKFQDRIGFNFSIFLINLKQKVCTCTTFNIDNTIKSVEGGNEVMAEKLNLSLIKSS